MNESILMYVIYCLNELVKDPPDLIFFDSFILILAFGDEVVEGASFTKFHDDIDCEVFFIDLKVKVSEDVYVIHLDESVDFVDDVLFLFGRD